MIAEVYLADPGYEEHQRIGTIDIKPDTSFHDLGENITNCILSACQNSHNFSDVFNHEVETRTASLIASGDNRPPLFRFSTTMTILGDSGKVLGRVAMNMPYWKRFDSMKDFCRTDIQAIPKMRVNINFTSEPVGSDESPPDGLAFVLRPLERRNDEYIRVGHIQAGPDLKPFAISRRTQGTIPAKHCILAKVSSSNPAETAEKLLLSTAWEIDGIANTIGDPGLNNSVSYGSIHNWGKGLFSGFKGTIGEHGRLADETDLGRRVNHVHNQHLAADRTARVAGRTPLRQLYHAPILPRMTLMEFGPNSLGNTSVTAFAANVDCHVVVRVVYHTEDFLTDHETIRYPQTAQFKIAGAATMQILEDNLFTSYTNDAQRVQQPVDKFRGRSDDETWHCQWFILPRTDNLQLMHKVYDMTATVASFVDTTKSSDKVFVYTECHIMRSDVMEEIGSGFG